MEDAPSSSQNDRQSIDPYNEAKARREFGNESIDLLKKGQRNFKGDWWQLALLMKNLDDDAENLKSDLDEPPLNEWNRWRAECEALAGTSKYEYVHLEHAVLKNAQLEHAMLSRAHLQEADFEDAHLDYVWLNDACLQNARLGGAKIRHAHLSSSHLEDSYLRGVHFEHTDLYGAHLKRAVLIGAHLEHASLGGADLEDATLTNANLQHAWLAGPQCQETYGSSFGIDMGRDFPVHDSSSGLADGARLSRAILIDANLENAKLIGVDFTDAHLGRANLERAQVRGAIGLLFDENRFDGIHIEGDATDPWSTLRRKYTGPWFFIHLLLLGLFFVPYVARTLTLTAQSRLQEWSIAEGRAVDDRMTQLSLPRVLHRPFWDEFILHRAYRPAIWIALGLHKGSWQIILALIVVIYNLLRGYLTLRVGLLRDAEERSKITPKLTEYHGLCHPLNMDNSIRWWKRMMAIVHVWMLNHQGFRWRTAPHWLRQKLGGVRWLRTLRIMQSEPPPSLLDYLGLYRLHRVASVLIPVVLLAIVISTVSWATETWIWVPIE